MSPRGKPHQAEASSAAQASRGPDDTVDVELSFPATLSNLPVIRARVEEIATTAADLGEADIENLKLVLSEVIANAVSSSQAQSSRDTEVTLHCEVSPDRIEVSVTDQGGGFAITGSHPVIDMSLPDVSQPEVQAREGGFGLGLIDAYADETEFTRIDGGMAVRFVIYPAGA